MKVSTLHALISKGDVKQVEAALRDAGGAINAYDQDGYTPLMYAVTASVEVMRTLLEHGADIAAEVRSTYSSPRNVMALALGAGDPAKVRLLLQYGADLHYQRTEGYGAIIDAVTGRDVFNDERLLDLLQLLIASGVDLNLTTSYGESACGILSRLGRFDAMRLLLEAGADEGQLQWTPLLRAVALGSIAEVEVEIGRAASLEDPGSVGTHTVAPGHSDRGHRKGAPPPEAWRRCPGARPLRQAPAFLRH